MLHILNKSKAKRKEVAYNNQVVVNLWKKDKNIAHNIVDLEWLHNNIEHCLVLIRLERRINRIKIVTKRLYIVKMLIFPILTLVNKKLEMTSTYLLLLMIWRKKELPKIKATFTSIIKILHSYMIINNNLVHITQMLILDLILTQS